MDYILTGRKAIEAQPDSWILNTIGSSILPLKVLDFGCGVGRNTFGAAIQRPKWWVVGYDNDGMISKKDEFFALHYKPPVPLNVVFTSDWEAVKAHQFDVIFCSLVLQHIYEDALVTYLKDFRLITQKLIVSGRRSNDDPKGRITWRILEEQGWTPNEFFHNGNPIDYTPDGHPEEHHTAIYENSTI